MFSSNHRTKDNISKFEELPKSKPSKHRKHELIEHWAQSNSFHSPALPESFHFSQALNHILHRLLIQIGNVLWQFIQESQRFIFLQETP